MTHYLVKGDTGSVLKSTLIRVDTGEPFDCSNSTVYLRFRKKGTSSILFSLTGVIPDPNVKNEVIFSFGNNLANITEGLYEGEIGVISNTINTVYEIIPFQVRRGFN